MSQTGYIIIALIAAFVFSHWMMLRPSPRDRLLGVLRERAKQLGLIPRLVAAPAWIGVRPDTQQSGGMVAFYHLVLPDATLPLTQAKVVEGRLRVIHGVRTYHGQPFDVVGAIALEMQVNSVGLYWNEEADIRGEHLERLKAAMLGLAQQPASPKLHTTLHTES